MRQYGQARHHWERLPLVSLAATVMMVIQGSAIFTLDRRQRSTSNRSSSAWINHFAKYIDEDVLPNLPHPYGLEYTQGVHPEGDRDTNITPSLRVTPHMLYTLADTLGIQHLPPTDRPKNLIVSLPMPLLPGAYQCLQCNGALYQPSSGHITKAWVLEPYNAHRVPIFAGECRHCRTKTFPDRFMRLSPNSDTAEEEVFIPSASAIQLGRGRYASRQLANMLSTCVTSAHMPLSTFATCWNASGSHLDENGDLMKISHKHMWRLFVIHHILLFSHPNEEFVLPAPVDEADEAADGDEEAEINVLSPDQRMVQRALTFWESVPSGHYHTYRLRDTAAHRCIKCAHFHRSFRPGDVTDTSTEAELLEAHRNVIEDQTRIVTATVIDRMEKICHKVYLTHLR